MTGVIGVEAVVSERRKLSYLAYYDTLSGLPNGAGFDQHVEAAVERARDSGKPWLCSTSTSTTSSS